MGHKELLHPVWISNAVLWLVSLFTRCVSPHRWSLQRERLEQLSMQAVYNITHHNDEFVKDFLITHEKVRTLKLSSCVDRIILKKAVHFQPHLNLRLYTTLWNIQIHHVKRSNLRIELYLWIYTISPRLQCQSSSGSVVKSIWPAFGRPRSKSWLDLFFTPHKMPWQIFWLWQMYIYMWNISGILSMSRLTSFPGHFSPPAWSGNEAMSF